MATVTKKAGTIASPKQLSDEEYLALDEVEFRARFRERAHHTLEIQLYASAYRSRPISATQADTAKRLLGLWERRALSKDEHDYAYVTGLVTLAEESASGTIPDFSRFSPRALSHADTEAFFTVVRDRRSVREFKADRVPDELIDRVLDAGLWAAHSCNLQSIRYLVIREENAPGLFKGSDVPGGPVHLVVLQDERVYRANPYMPERNLTLDAGAAAQNIALAAHATGLEGVWLTFNDEIIARLRERFALPDYIRIVTYVDVGYGDQTPMPVCRPKVGAVVLGRV
jgi:nitroreductase